MIKLQAIRRPQKIIASSYHEGCLHMTVPSDMIDIFPALSLGGVALIGLMARLEPQPLVRWSITGALALALALYLTGQIQVLLPDRIGVPVYLAMLAVSGAIIWWNGRAGRASKQR